MPIRPEAMSNSRKQNRSCDQCRKGKRKCDLTIFKYYKTFDASVYDVPSPCSYCRKTKKDCTLGWLQELPSTQKANDTTSSVLEPTINTNEESELETFMSQSEILTATPSTSLVNEFSCMSQYQSQSQADSQIPIPENTQAHAQTQTQSQSQTQIQEYTPAHPYIQYPFQSQISSITNDNTANDIWNNYDTPSNGSQYVDSQNSSINETLHNDYIISSIPTGMPNTNYDPSTIASMQSFSSMFGDFMGLEPFGFGTLVQNETCAAYPLSEDWSNQHSMPQLDSNDGLDKK